MLSKSEATEMILEAKAAKGTTFDEIADDFAKRHPRG